MRYRTIVADPPWHYDKAGAYSWRKGCPSGETRPMLTYGTMTVAEIAAIPVGAFADDAAHLYIWTTQRYLLDAHDIVRARARFGWDYWGDESLGTATMDAGS